MELSEYLTRVTEQIRCKKARPMIEEELKGHILEQAEAYEREGMTQKEAMEEAVRQMGDPAEAGSELDRIHRPRLEWRLVLLVVFLSALGLLIQQLICETKFFEASGSHFMKNQLLFTAAGLFLMFAVYAADYTALARCPLLLWFGGLTAVWFLSLFYFNVIAGRIRIYNYLTLFLPLYAGVLYRFRSKRYGAAAVCYLISLTLIFTGMKTILIHGSVELALCCHLLLLAAVWKGIIPIKKWAAALVIIAVPAVSFALLYRYGAQFGIIVSYQEARVEAIVRGAAGYGDYAYGEQALIREVLAGLQLYGPSAVSLPESLKYMNSNYVIFFVFARFGAAAGSLVLALLAFTMGKTFLIAWRQKNRLGFLVGMACFLVLSIQALVYVLANFGVPMIEPMTIPFLAYGGQSTIVNYVLIGLTLSIYRNKDITSERQMMKRRWRIRLERIQE